MAKISKGGNGTAVAAVEDPTTLPVHPNAREPEEGAFVLGEMLDRPGTIAELHCIVDDGADFDGVPFVTLKKYVVAGAMTDRNSGTRCRWSGYPRPQKGGFEVKLKYEVFKQLVGETGVEVVEIADKALGVVEANE